MKLKELEGWLTQCDDFARPKVALEQYATSAHVAARMLYSAQEFIEGAVVCDLGCGCGVLSIGAVMAGASLVYGFEVDPDALEIASNNVQAILEDEDGDGGSLVQFIQCRVGTNAGGESEGENSKVDACSGFDSFFDMVIMNPPFGTKNNAGADYGFLKRAIQLVKPGGHVFTLHKTSTRPFFKKKLSSPETEFGCNVEGSVLAEIRYDLPKCYRFHKEKNVDIEVDFWHFEKLE